MISREVAQQCVSRFAGTIGFSKLDNMALGELLVTYRRMALTEAHALKITDELLRERQWPPTVSDIVKMANTTRDQFQTKRHCPRCDGVGFIPHEPQSYEGRTYAFVRLCPACRGPLPVELN